MTAIVSSFLGIVLRFFKRKGVIKLQTTHDLFWFFFQFLMAFFWMRAYFSEVVSNNRNCGTNEEFKSCGTACEPSCQNPTPVSEVISLAVWHLEKQLRRGRISAYSKPFDRRGLSLPRVGVTNGLDTGRRYHIYNSWETGNFLANSQQALSTSLVILPQTISVHALVSGS